MANVTRHPLLGDVLHFGDRFLPRKAGKFWNWVSYGRRKLRG